LRRLDKQRRGTLREAVNPIVLIPARLGSTRLPGKPLADICGVPMIVHVLRRALEAGIGPVAVACAEQEIMEVVRAAGGTAVLTDPALPCGSDRIFAALLQLDPEQKHDVIINLQGDLPAIDPGYLADVCLPVTAQKFDIGTLVAPITSAAEADSFSVVKAACAFAEGETVAPALYFSRNRIPSGEGPLWHHIGVYAYRRAALARFVGLPESALERREKLEQLRALEDGMRIGAVRVAHAPFGVDTPDDLVHARLILGGAKE
jgi:3-deoxy-manno-octulosonate cytidylyltransferase (CMP-KDO synthetase)